MASTATIARADVQHDGPNRDVDLKISQDESSTLPPIVPISTANLPQSHRVRRKAKERRPSIASTTSPTTAPAISKPQSKPKANPNPNKPTRRTSTTVPPPPPSLDPLMPLGTPSPLFIASLGNPPPRYAHTLHSAGHTLLLHIALLRSFRPFARERSLANGLVSTPDTSNTKGTFLPRFRQTPEGQLAPGQEDWTLWQSPDLMNVSGKSVVQAWRNWRARRAGEAGVLVLVHDELEATLGKVTLRRGGSARGHNGLKSVMASLQGSNAGVKWEDVVRVGIGIGRPESRERDVVSQYVLRKMTPREMAAVERAAGEVIGVLREVEEGRR